MKVRQNKRIKLGAKVNIEVKTVFPSKRLFNNFITDLSSRYYWKRIVSNDLFTQLQLANVQSEKKKSLFDEMNKHII